MSTLLSKFQDEEENDEEYFPSLPEDGKQGV
jgi:hypothetical protein